MACEELVKRLREYAKEHCPLDRGSGICGCIDAREAAVAIEELSKQIDELQKRVAYWQAQLTKSMCGETLAELEKPRWVSVTERLPEDGSDVLAYVDNSRITAVNYYKETWQDCVTGRLYLMEEGFVTHWMPLPEPPKEEE